MSFARMLRWFLAPPRPQAKRKLARIRLEVESLEDRLVPAFLHVGSAAGEFATIQSAINAANTGDTVLVDPGIYQEQLTISKSITVEADSGCDQRCQGNSAIILAPTNLAAPTVADPGAIVHITGSGVCADVSGFVIEGAAATSTTPAGDANLLYGVRVDGSANAVISFNTIANIVDASGLVNGDLSSSFGVGVSVGNAGDSDDGLGAQVGTAIISLNNITNYQRGGIVVSNTGSSAAIALNSIVGTSVSPADSITGVEISEGAVGLVSLNAISNNTNNANQSSGDGCGVLLFAPGQGTTVAANAIYGNDYGVFGDSVVANSCGQGISFSYNAQFSGDSCTSFSLGAFNGCGVSYQSGQGTVPYLGFFGNNYGVFGNNFAGGACGGQGGISVSSNIITGNTFNGIELDNSSGVTISGNYASSNGGSTLYYGDGGIYLYQSTNNIITNNQTLNNYGSGIFMDVGSAGNTITGNTASGNYYSIPNVSADLVDETIGSGTAGTANTWASNDAVTSITLSGESLVKATKPHHFGDNWDFGF